MKRNKHYPVRNYIVVADDSRFGDHICAWGWPALVSEVYTATWTCQWKWESLSSGWGYVSADIENSNATGTDLPKVLQEFTVQSKTIEEDGVEKTVAETTIKKFNSMVTRDSGSTKQIRDVENNWQP